MVQHWWERVGEKWTQKVKLGHLGAERLSQRADIPLEHAEQFLAWLRTGTIPSLEDYKGPAKKPSVGRVRSWVGITATPSTETVKKAATAIKEAVANPFDSEQAYYYNAHTKSYVFVLSGSPKPVVIGEETVQQMQRAYSKEGEHASINEMARTFGMRRSWIQGILRALGTTHDSMPFTDEELNTKSEDEISEEATQIRKSKIHKRLEREKWRDEKNDALKWRDYEHHTLARLCSLVGEPYEVPKLVLPGGERKFAAVISPTDFHVGLYGSARETGEVDNRHYQRARLLKSTARAVADMAKFGKPEVIYVGCGSDWYHVDTVGKTTTKGTPQDTDGNTTDIFEYGAHLFIEFLDLLRQTGARIEVFAMHGNHDYLLGHALLQLTQAWFRNTPGISVHMDSTSTRQYATYGSTLMCLTHGDNIGKTVDLARLAATEKAREWGLSKHRIIFTGHKHYLLNEQDCGVVRVQLPSLSGMDSWSHKKGYVGASKMLAAVLIDYEDGMFGQLYAEGE